MIPTVEYQMRAAAPEAQSRTAAWPTAVRIVLLGLVAALLAGVFQWVIAPRLGL